MTATVVRAGIAVVAWTGLVLQFVLMVGGGAPGEAPWLTVKFFSYFTILTNLLVALTETLPLLAPASRPGRFFDRPGTRSAVAVYILIVGVVYWLLLANVWEPKGWQLAADIILHSVIPVLYLLDWLVFVPKSGLGWSDPARWLTYPLAYCGWAIVLGAATGYYAYWFLDVGALGVARAAVNALLLTGVFFLVGLAAVGASRIRR